MKCKYCGERVSWGRRFVGSGMCEACYSVEEYAIQEVRKEWIEESKDDELIRRAILVKNKIREEDYLNR